MAQQKLIAIMTKHVDDLKVAGEHAAVMKIMKVIEEVFGEMVISWHSFTNCGVRHIQNPTTKEITLDQSEYIAGLKIIPTSAYAGNSSNTPCNPVLHQLYQSLLGAVAFTGLTRLDAIVFIVALQRYSHASEIIHVKRLNVLVKWLQKNPKKISYGRFYSKLRHIKIIADSSFKKEEEKGHSLRGLLVLLCDGLDYTKGGVCHVLDFATKALRLVTRSTFSSELLGACDSFDHALMLLFIMNEISRGVPSKLDQKAFREHGGFAVPAALYIDALSVHAATCAAYIKPPAEKGLLAHVQYLREAMERNLLHALVWIDTRDMTSDGLTKGAVERLLLHLCMDGTIAFKHEMKLWRPALLRRNAISAQ